jgi:hypothetical protein
MNRFRSLIALVAAWAAAVTGLHLALNVDWAAVLNDRRPKGERKFHVAYIPVT